MISYDVIKLANIIENLDSDIRKMLEEITSYEEKTFEDSACIKSAEILVDAIEKANKIRNYMPKMQEGYLEFDENGYYTIGEQELNCGRYMELFDPSTGWWIQGRVEHNGDEYYFCNYVIRNRPLKSGMRARTIA